MLVLRKSGVESCDSVPFPVSEGQLLPALHNCKDYVSLRGRGGGAFSTVSWIFEKITVSWGVPWSTVEQEVGFFENFSLGLIQCIRSSGG